MYLYCFTFHPTPATEIYTLSLHDALPISCLPPSLRFGRGVEALDRPALRVRRVGGAARRGRQRGEGAAGARGIAGVARLGTRAPEPPRRGRRPLLRAASCEVPRIFRRARLRSR